jgi:hypothetical protein
MPVPERRDAPRYEARHAARLRFVTLLADAGGGDGPGLWPTLICQTRDVSESGAALLVPVVRNGDEDFFGVEGPVRVTLGLPTGALEAGAVAVRYERAGVGAWSDEFLICVKFTDMDGAATKRLRAHIRAGAPAPDERSP